MIVSNKVTFSKISSKYFSGYENDDEKVMLLLLQVHTEEILRRLNMCLF